jgi:dTMP kinase
MERLKKTRNLDKFERENKNFHENIRKKYLMLANACPERFVVLDSQKSIEEIQCQIKLKLDEALK